MHTSLMLQIPCQVRCYPVPQTSPNPLLGATCKRDLFAYWLINFPFYANILTFRIISIHEFIGLWAFRKLHVFHLQHSWCICWSGEGVWRCEPFCPTTGGLNSYQNSLWGIFQPAFWNSGWSFPDCVKKTPTKMVITNYMAKHRMQSNKKCNTNPFHQIPSDCCAFLFNITLFFGVNLHWSCFLSDFHFAAFHRECLSLKKKILLSGRASTGKSSNPLVTINAVQYHPPISFSMEPENDGVSPKGISSTRRSCCGSVPHPLFSPMVPCF